MVMHGDLPGTQKRAALETENWAKLTSGEGARSKSGHILKLNIPIM